MTRYQVDSVIPFQFSTRDLAILCRVAVACTMCSINCGGISNLQTLCRLIRTLYSLGYRRKVLEVDKSRRLPVASSD